ncbi:hypothetical protein DFH11DRAFT_1545673 [Phellopilus nigrolimitatus]|nr:hypothetical protein DFH11DRAFT_1545673 [Phellopilus nigrolimitatus]
MDLSPVGAALSCIVAGEAGGIYGCKLSIPRPRYSAPSWFCNSRIPRARSARRHLPPRLRLRFESATERSLLIMTSNAPIASAAGKWRARTDKINTDTKRAWSKTRHTVLNTVGTPSSMLTRMPLWDELGPARVTRTRRWEDRHRWGFPGEMKLEPVEARKAKSHTWRGGSVQTNELVRPSRVSMMK